MIYEIPKHETTIDLSKITAISRKEYVPAKKEPLWKIILGMGWVQSTPEYPARVRISPEKWYATDFKYDTDKEAKKVYKDIVKAWKGE